MNRTVLATSVAAVTLLAPLLGMPDAKTDFSGTWEMDAARSESAHSGDSQSPVTVVIKQTASDISVETRQEGQSETIVYRMDGSETEKPPPDNGPYKWRARWDGPKLITETHRNINSTAVTVLEIRSLSGNGREMTVNRTLTVQHGYSGTGAQ